MATRLTRRMPPTLTPTMISDMPPCATHATIPTPLTPLPREGGMNSPVGRLTPHDLSHSRRVAGVRRKKKHSPPRPCDGGAGRGGYRHVRAAVVLVLWSGAEQARGDASGRSASHPSAEAHLCAMYPPRPRLRWRSADGRRGLCFCYDAHGGGYASAPEWLPTPLRGWCRHNPLYHGGMRDGRWYPNPVSGVGVSLRVVAGMCAARGDGRAAIIRQPLKRGWDTPSLFLAYHVMAGYAYINPLAGLTLTHPSQSYHVMAGYAYINPLAGLPLTHPSRSYHIMAGYAYINPLAGLTLTRLSRSYHVMAGYAYINPLAGLTPTHPSLSPYVMEGYAYINPLAGLTPTHPSLSPHVMEGYAYINPLAGLTPGGLSEVSEVEEY